MKRQLILPCLLVLAALPAAADEPATLDSNLQKFSYAMGFRMARDLLQQGITNVDAAALAVGASDALGGNDFRFSPDEMRAVMTAYQQEMIKAREVEAQQNESEGAQFMEANASKDGVETLDNGVQYKVVSDGSGAKPVASDKVKVHYRGRLLDGTEFDSSYKRGQPAELTISDVIPGWQQALQAMPVGAKWVVWIPPAQAYGERGAGAAIGPNSTLEFDIELIEIVQPE